MYLKRQFLLSLFIFIALSVYSQNRTFDELSDDLNRISQYNKTKSQELLRSLYAMAGNSPDSSLFIARCLYEESLLNSRQGITDDLLADRIEQRLDKEHIPIHEHALLQLALGTDLVANGEYSEAFTIHLQAVEKFKQLKNNRFTATTLNALGNICTFISLFSLAEYYYSEAIKYVTTDFYGYFSIKGSIFKHDLYINKKPDALDSLLRLVEDVKKAGYKEILPATYLNLVGYLMNTDNEKAFFYMTKIETLDFENPKWSTGLYNNMGHYYFIHDDLLQALHYFKKSQNIMEENGDFYRLSSIYSNISTIFEELNMPDSALFYARKYDDITKMLRSNTIAVETHQKNVNASLEAHKKELIIAEQKVALKNKQFTIIITVSTFVVLLILLFLLFINQQKRRKASENRELTARLEHEMEVQQFEKRQQKLEIEKQEVIMEAKTREITSYSLLVSNKNQILKQIMELNAQVFENKENAVEVAAKIDDIIKGDLNIDEEWENFKLHFDKVHPYFFEKLKQSCSDLTEDNLKMCAYFKIGMTNKQIAQIMNVIPNSIITSRYRLKKKLQLSDSEDFDDFIRKL